MNQDQLLLELLTFFKALADASRLRIVGVLASGEASVEQLAAVVGLRASTISHHLSRLQEADIVSARSEGHYSLYRLETKTLERKARKILSQEAVSSIVHDLDLSVYDRQVLEAFSHSDGRLKQIPAQRRKRLVILQHLVRVFEKERRYCEAEVNAILSAAHEDTATLRREMIAEKLLARCEGTYWRVDP